MYDLRLRTVLLLKTIAVAFTGGWMLTAGQTAAAEFDIADIRPTDCFIHATQFGEALEELRLEMGSPKADEFQLVVQNAAPREVYFQAETMFTKINRLSFQHLRKEFPPLEAPPGEIRPGHVLEVIKAARGVLGAMMNHYGIAPPAEAFTTTEEKVPTDVFLQINGINRQLNVMLDVQFSPSDVFERVTQCVNHATALRSRFPGQHVPETPPFEARKIPADVYGVLRECFEIVERIAAASGLSTLDLAVEIDQSEQQITPSDVYDFASLLLSELQYFHKNSSVDHPPRESYPPGRKFPAHVHQRARLLRAQLIELESLALREPGWLG